VSDWSTIETALIAAARVGVSSIPSGATGAEVGVREPSQLPADAFPHLFVHSEEEQIELLDHLQERRTVRTQMSLVTNDGDHDGMSTKLDAIRDAIHTDRTLGGIVDHATVTARAIGEAPMTLFREGLLEVTTVEEV
jgi:hypothetical protein